MDYIKIEKDELMMWLKEHLSEKDILILLGQQSVPKIWQKDFV